MSSWYMTHAWSPTFAASGLASSTATRMSVPGAFVCDVPNFALEAPAFAATTAPPCHATMRPPAFTQSRRARLPLAPSAWTP